MPEHQIEHTKTIGNYIEKNREELQKKGFSEEEATIITDAEGLKLTLNYNSKVVNSQAISKHEVEIAQNESKMHLVKHNSIKVAVENGADIAKGTATGIQKDVAKTTNVKHSGMGFGI